MVVRLRRSETMSALSLTPLIDVVFLLLVFFLVAARFADEDRKLDVLLPSATQAVPMVTQARELVVNIDARGQVFLARNAIDLQQLKQIFQQAASDNPFRQSVVIRADRRCAWDMVVKVMDLCHAAGIRDIHPSTAAEPSP